MQMNELNCVQVCEYYTILKSVLIIFPMNEKTLSYEFVD